MQRKSGTTLSDAMERQYAEQTRKGKAGRRQQCEGKARNGRAKEKPRQEPCGPAKELNSNKERSI